ncbi:MAG: FtsX-like permease family protein, partial [Lachnospiraceae bacterium]|nr:FtsX-like permease family protein [Lachnospiraceae bacterium]
LAAAPAAHFAAKVSPVTAMHGTISGGAGNAKIRRNHRKAKKIRGFEQYYAALNMRRNKSRTVITILSMVMSITVFVTLQGYLSHLSVTGAESEHLGDYSVVNEYVGFSSDELNQMEADPDVAAVAAQQFTLYELDEQYYPMGIETDIDFAQNPVERFQIYGVNDYWADYRFEGQLTEEQLNALKAGEGCVVRNPLPVNIEGLDAGTTCIEEGSTITIAGKKMKVLMTLNGYDGYFSVGNNGFCVGVQVIVSDQLYPQLTGTDTYAEFRPILNADADREMFDHTLESLCTRIAGTTWVSYEDTDRQLAESEAQIKMLAWGLILLIGLIGILNIVNTVYTNIHTRVTEIGTQRAIGMSAKSLYKTFLWEGAYYGIYAAVIGSVAGYLCTLLVNSSGTGTIQLTVPSVAAMMEAAVLSIA